MIIFIKHLIPSILNILLYFIILFSSNKSIDYFQNFISPNELYPYIYIYIYTDNYCFCFIIITFNANKHLLSEKLRFYNIFKFQKTIIFNLFIFIFYPLISMDSILLQKSIIYNENHKMHIKKSFQDYTNIL